MTAKIVRDLEKQRQAVQAELDRARTQAERNEQGQFATPPALAEDILRHASNLLGTRRKVQFLDPALGTGAFYSALRTVFPAKRVDRALGLEIDPHYGRPAARLWKRVGLTVKHADFTAQKPDSRYSLVICNPPYVRHHHLESDQKTRLQVATYQASGMRLSGLAGLYCHFLGLAHAWMAEGAIAGWLIPSEFMDVNYGDEVKRYLLTRVTLLHIHRFDPDDVQFADALVSSAVVWFRNERPPKDHAVSFTFGGSLDDPKVKRVVSAEILARESKWTRFPAREARSSERTPVLSDLFRIKRGVATGDNGYFILSEQEIVERRLPWELFTPVLPSPRHLTSDVVRVRPDGTPDIDRRLFLLDTRLDEDTVRQRYPTLHEYLQLGRQRGLHERYLCAHRTPWYLQERRPPAPIVCTYLGRSDTKRSQPFRFILNFSGATVANVYLAMYPVEALADALTADAGLIERVWQALRALTAEQLLGEGRVYGGGLHKLEPRELANVDASDIVRLLPLSAQPVAQPQLSIFAVEGPTTATRSRHMPEPA